MKNIALYENSSKPEAYRWASYTAEKLIRSGYTVYVRESLSAKFSTELKNIVKTITLDQFEKYIDAVISFGGDGTMLSACRDMLNKDIPVMGINVGKLGFLAEYPVDDIDTALDFLITGKYRIVDRSCLLTEINGETILAVNDFIIEKKNTVRLITIKAYTDEHFVADYRADGLIVTTPTGSTGYSLSCGGPIIPPSANVICLTPVAPHTLTLRPLVLPDSSVISLSIESHSGEAGVVADGIIERRLKNGEKIIIRKAAAKVKMIKPIDSSYFDLLRKKLLWAATPGS